MPSYQILNDDIVCIDTQQIRPGLAACYLVGAGGRYALVEAGTSLSVPLVLAVLDELGIARSAVDYVMPTHVHLDHAGGAGALLQALPQAKLVVHPRGAPHLIDPARLIAGATEVYGEAMVRQMYGDIIPAPESRVVVANVANGARFNLTLGGERMLALVDVQGHARHHYAIWDEQSAGWFTGDTFGSSYRALDHRGRAYIMPTTTPIDFDPDAWQQSLDRFLSTSPAYMYLTHYGRVHNVERLARELRQSLHAYVQIAQDAADQPDRSAWLTRQLTDYHLQQLQERELCLPDARLRELIALDVQINVQGLSVWLDRQKKAA